METINIFASGFGEWLIPWEEWAESLQAFLGQSLGHVSYLRSQVSTAQSTAVAR